MSYKDVLSKRGKTADIEAGTDFAPKFDDAGLIAAVATDRATGEVLMLAWMNADALARSMETGVAHFWSRSRKTLWMKGETSGNILRIAEMRTDCDQDAIWLRVTVEGDGMACHTGKRTCFYRSLPLGAARSGPHALVFDSQD